MKKRVKQIVSAMLITMMALQVLPTSVFTTNAAEVTGTTWTDETTGIMYEYYGDISEFRTMTEGSYLKHPEEAGYVFAGWWTEESVSSQNGVSKSASSIDDDKTDEGAWAKFVPEDVLTVKAQTSMKVSDALDKEGAVDENGNLTAKDGEGIKLRLVTSVDDSDLYAEIGFKVKVKSEKIMSTKKFFEELTITENEDASKIYPKDSFDPKASGEFAVLVIGGFKTVDHVNATALNVTPYWKTLDGTIVYGTNRPQLLASDERANDQDGSKTDGKEDFDVASGTYQYDNTLANEATSYKYFEGVSDTVYLETKYTTAGTDNHFGITIRNGGETRQIYFDNLGVKVLAGNSKTVSGLVDLEANSYNTYGAKDGVSVWIQRAENHANFSDSSVIATMLKDATGKPYTVIWAIENNVLYCSVDNHAVLSMPMEKLCDKWQLGRYYQLGVAAYNEGSTDSQLKLNLVDLQFGKNAKAKLKPEEKLPSGQYNMTYEPITGSHLISDITKGAANVSVKQVKGTSGASANITWAWSDCEWAYAGVYVMYDGVPYEFYVKGHTNGIVRQENNQKEKDLTAAVKNQGITPFETGSHTSKVVAIIQDGHLYIFYNGQQALDVNLQTLYPSYDKEKSVIELGFACSVMHKGLAYFQDVKSMTEDDIQKMGVTKWKFSAESFANVSSVDYANGKIVNKGTSGGEARVNFMGDSDKWEVTGTMYVDPSDTTSLMQPQFFITNGTTTFSPCLRSQGPRIIYGEWNYTSGDNSNSKNGALTFNKTNTKTEKFSVVNATRTKFEMDFKVVIANDVMYVWFESDAQEGKLLPAWRLPLTTPIYQTDVTKTPLFNGFTPSDTPLKYNFALGNTASCAKGGYKNLTVKTGDEVDITCISAGTEFLFKDTTSNYMAAWDEEKKVPTVMYEGTADVTAALYAATVGTQDDVYVEAVLKKGSEFVPTYRVGYLFGDMTLEVVENANGLQFSMYGPNWSPLQSTKFTEEQKQAFEGNGLKIGAARFGGKYYMFVEKDGAMEKLLELTTETYAETSFDIKLKTTAGAKKAVYSNLKWEIGNSADPRTEFDTTEDQAKWQNVTDGSTTVFIGDSFFDQEWFFKSFDSLYEGKDALCLGVSSTTSYDWVKFANSWFGEKQPKNLVVNIGTNNIYDDKDLTMETVKGLQELFTLLKTKMPDTNIYWFSISQRVDKTYADRVTNVNQIMQAWCSANGIVYIETPLVNPALQTSDGIHPTAECYELYKTALEEAGCEINNKQ